MKRIKNTLIAGVFACAAFNAQAEVDPFSFGLKVGASITPYVRGTNDVKIDTKDIQHCFLDNPFAYGSLYGEYAFNDYVGLSLGAGYLKQGFTLTEKKDTDDSNSSSTRSISMMSHGIEAPLSLCVYPLGREEEQGILKVMLGAAAYIPLKTTCKRNSEEIPSANQENKITTFGLAAKLGLEYEFNFGLSIGANGGINLLNKLKLEQNSAGTDIFNPTSNSNRENNFNVTHLKEAKPGYFTIGLGYNFASLFTE